MPIMANILMITTGDQALVPDAISAASARSARIRSACSNPKVMRYHHDSQLSQYKS